MRKLFLSLVAAAMLLPTGTALAQRGPRAGAMRGNCPRQCQQCQNCQNCPNRPNCPMAQRQQGNARQNQAPETQNQKK